MMGAERVKLKGFNYGQGRDAMHEGLAPQSRARVSFYL